MPEGTGRPTHRLYIDDSGTKEYSPDGRYDSGNTRYFVLGGVLVSLDVGRQLARDLRAVKEQHLGTANAEIKSNWLRIPKERSRRYLSQYNLSEEKLTSFVDDYYDCFLGKDLTIIAAVVDKVHMADDYDSPWYPPAVAYELLVQRAQLELEGSGSFSVEIDNMSGKTPNNNPYDRNLMRQHALLQQYGSTLRKGMRLDGLAGRLVFVDSARSELVQVADLVAYNVFRQFREHGEEWEEEGLKKLPTYAYFRRLSEKFRSGPGGRIQGYGVVKMPLRTRVRWGVRRRGQGAP